jgi:UDP-glucose 4-epimerase
MVTGAGAIGQLTAGLLAAKGEAIVVIDIRRPGTLPPGTPFEQCDVTDVSALADVIRNHGVTHIVHTAAVLSSGMRRDPVEGIRANVMGTMHILECARQAGVKRVVCASSTTVAYTTFGGRGPELIQEDEPLKLLSQRPASLYAASKITGEHLALLYRDLHGLDVVSLRYGAVLGGALDQPTSIPGRLLARLADGGRTGRKVQLDDPLLLWGGREEFVDARDCARANISALEAASPKQGVYNIATGAWFSLAEFIEAVRLLFPALEVAYPEPFDTGFAGFPAKRPAPSSTEAARRELGFQAQFTLASSISYWTAAVPAAPA